MFDILIERIRQKKRTVAFPGAAPSLPPRFRGRPFIDAERCAAVSGESCDACRACCPSGAIGMDAKAGPCLDMGLCTFCGSCARVCPHSALVFTTDWRLGSTERDALIIRPEAAEGVVSESDTPGAIVQSLPHDPRKSFRLQALPLRPYSGAKGSFGRSFRMRQVTAAGCGACEADLNVLTTVVFDISRFGMDFVASPRHADGLMLTGPVPGNMREALLKCHAAMPAPKPVIAVGACAISGGLFRTRSAMEQGCPATGASPHVPVDLYIPGCPPHPYTTLDALLRFLGRRSYIL